MWTWQLACVADLAEPCARAQLVHAYNAAIKRNDQALFHYGFVQEQDPPKLAAQDLPGGNLYDPSKYSEEDHSAPRPCP